MTFILRYENDLDLAESNKMKDITEVKKSFSIVKNVLKVTGPGTQSQKGKSGEENKSQIMLGLVSSKFHSICRGLKNFSAGDCPDEMCTLKGSLLENEIK